MTDVAALIVDLIEAGNSAELVGRVAAALAEPRVVVDEAAERRREKDRERKRIAKLSAETARNSAETVATPSPSPSPSPDKEIPPTPPKENNLFPLPPSTPRVSGEREQALFDRFWAAYPHKVGKGDARKAFSKALNRVDVETMAAGLKRYAAKSDDRPWCNPATWLNQDRWADAPAQAPPRSPPRSESVLDRRSRELRERIANEHGIGGERDRDPEPSGGLLRLADHRRER